MYNVTRVLDKLLGRVGWKQPTQTEYAIITEPNTLSKSGRYFQDVHAAVSIKNIFELQEDENLEAPGFNSLLEDLQNAAILETLTAVFSSREVVDTIQTFDKIDNVTDSLLTNTGKFVGFKVYIGATNGFATALTSVSLYFDKDITFELKCFVDNKHTPIWTKLVEATGGETTIIDVEDLVLSYMSGTSNTTVFYIGYFQEDLGLAKAFTESILRYNYGCLWSAQPFEAVEAAGKFIIPITPTGYSYGLNLKFTSYADSTNDIIANAALLDEAVGLQMACKVLELILSSTRSNSVERITKEMLGDIYKSLNQDRSTAAEPYAPGLKARYDGEIKKLHRSFFGVPKIETHSLPYAVYAEQNIGTGRSY